MVLIKVQMDDLVTVMNLSVVQGVAKSDGFAFETKRNVEFTMMHWQTSTGTALTYQLTSK